jgi:very-short-patch-repair endonuclease
VGGTVPTVTIPHRLSNRFASVKVHESTDLFAEMIVDIDGLATTTIARTLFDLGADLAAPHHHSVVQKALLDSRTTLADLEGVLKTIGRRGRPGTAAMRAFLETADKVLETAESELERRFIELVRRSGLPEPELQASLPWRSSTPGRVDFLFTKWRLIAETDGRTWHATAEAFARDRQRDNLAQLAGYRVLRFTWEDLVERPKLVVRQLGAVLSEPHAA